MYDSEMPNVSDPLDSGQTDWSWAQTDEVLEVGHKVETSLFVENSSFFHPYERKEYIKDRARSALFLREYSLNG